MRIHCKGFINILVCLCIFIAIVVIISSSTRDVITITAIDRIRAYRKPNDKEDVHFDDQNMIEESLKEVRVLCWILTSRENRLERAYHAATTWGKRCDKLLYMSGRDDEAADNVVPLPVDEGRKNLWTKTKLAFQYIYEKHRDEADWFVKADDDT